MRAMVLWSGGVESTSLLKWVLTKTDWQVHAHHVRMSNRDGRGRMEDRALHDLLPRLSTMRKFGGITYSDVNACQGHALPPDYWLTLPLGAAAAVHKGCDVLLRGWCAEDDWQRLNVGDMRQYVAQEQRGQRGRWQDVQAVLRPFCPPGVPADVYCPWLEPHTWAKAQHVAFLGDWARFTWSCRRPKATRPCGECFSCHERAAADRGESTVRTVQAELGNAD